jgi:DNA-binding GntR family transcriptional regulator
VQAAKLFAVAATEEERAELQKLAARVDAMSAQGDANRVVYLSLHERLHRRIAECARCPALSQAIEKTHALASTWRCVVRPPSAGPPRRSHQKLVEALTGGDPAAAAEAMHQHIASSMQNALDRLEPYFRRRKTSGKTYLRSAKKQQMITSADASAPASHR